MANQACLYAVHGWYAYSQLPNTWNTTYVCRLGAYACMCIKMTKTAKLYDSSL